MRESMGPTPWRWRCSKGRYGLPRCNLAMVLMNALLGFRGSYAPVWSEKRNSFLSLIKNKGFKKERMTKVGLYAIGNSTPLESNKSLVCHLRSSTGGQGTNDRLETTAPPDRAGDGMTVADGRGA